MAEHNGWCETELGTNALTRKDKAEAADQVAAELDSLETKKVKLAQDIEDLQEEISEMADALATATKERAAEKAEHEKAIADAKQGQDAVAQALAVLREFYERKAEATALAQAGQTPGEDAPETWSSSFRGQGQSAGVIGMLEVIQSDFERQQVSAEAAEMEAVNAHKKFSADTDRETAVCQTTLENKQQKAEETDSLLVSTKRSLDQTQKQLEAANDYYEKLQGACLAKVDFDERNRRRDEEIESLTDAYKILAGEDLPSIQEIKAESIGS